MREDNITKCDGCDRILEGVSGTAKVNLPYLVIKGGVRMSYADRRGTRHILFAREYKEPENLKPEDLYFYFCNGFCLDDYMGSKLILKAKYHEEAGLPFIDVEYVRSQIKNK